MAGGNNGIDLSFRRSNTVFGSSLEINGNILNLLNRNGDVISSVEIDLIKRDALPEANAENLGLIYLYTGETGEYTHGNIYECVENSGVYSWESETYNKTETDAELAKKLNTDGSNIFTGVLKMKSTISFKGAIAPSWDGIGFFKLNDNNSVSLMASMEDIDGFSPASNNTYNIGTNTRKWKDLYLAGKAYTSTINNGGDITVPTSAGTMALTSDLTNFADKDLSNLTSTGKNIANWSSNVSNCITEIPQDIKVELNNGTLTLKAGSELTDPIDGTKRTTTGDRSGTLSIDGQYMVFVDKTNGSFQLSGNYKIANTGSGSSLPADNSTYNIFYNTTDRTIYRWTSSGWTSWGVAFPIGIITVSGGAISSIDQVFNGFGYIGSTVYALPGVKGLIPNGRNEDGTLKSIERVASSVITRTYTTETATDIWFNLQNNFIGGLANGVYNEAENLLKNPSGVIQLGFVFAKADLSNGKIQNWKSYTPFHAVDYNDKSTISGWAMPSNKYISLTLGADGATYTAPANGFLVLNKASTASGQRVVVQNTSKNLSASSYSSNSGQFLSSFCLGNKGDVFTVRYTAEGTTSVFRFIYAEGSK